MTAPFGRFTVGDTGAVVTVNGHRDPSHLVGTNVEAQDVAAVVRSIRTVVAKRLTDETRRHEQTTGAAMPAAA